MDNKVLLLKTWGGLTLQVLGYRIIMRGTQITAEGGESFINPQVCGVCVCVCVYVVYAYVCV